MRRIYAILSVIFIAALGAITLFPPSDYLIWNPTESAPKGLYWRSDGPLISGTWAVVSGKAPAAKWIAENGFLAADWPIIKRVAGVQGDEVCRRGVDVFINETHVATALEEDSQGHQLPVWSGCFIVGNDQLFLLNNHPRSLDGRYFGATNKEDVTGGARLLLRLD